VKFVDVVARFEILCSCIIPVRVWLGKIFDDESGFLSTYGCMSARARGGQAFCVRDLFS
jgi:hypothetical protein